ncbi:5-oxoprolinase subunit PxpA [soil metagenome]
MKKPNIKITSDLGEGLKNEAELVPYLHSCSIACGYHAGDMDTMRHTVALAIEKGVEIGAHPSFPDRKNFGRKKMDLSLPDLIAAITDQVNTLNFICEEFQVTLRHIKPHGALYNLAIIDEATAEAIIEAINALQLDLILYTPYQGKLAKLAKENNIKILYEAFADRKYMDDLTLVDREHPGAVIYDPHKVWEHVKLMLEQTLVKTLSGRKIPILPDIYCIHGDNPNALAILQHLHEKLTLN